jgi:hypothetical protein
MNVILDGPEARKATLVRSACIRCLTPRCEFHTSPLDLNAAQAKQRNATEMESIIDECDDMMAARRHDRDGTVTRVKAKVDEVHGRPLADTHMHMTFLLFNHITTPLAL